MRASPTACCPSIKSCRRSCAWPAERKGNWMPSQTPIAEIHSENYRFLQQHVCHVVDPEPAIDLEIAIWKLPQLPLRGRRVEVVDYGVGVLKEQADLLVGVRARLENAGHRRSESVDTRVVAVLPLARRDVAVLEQDRVGGQAVFARSAHGASLPLVATPASTVSPEARSTSATSRTSWAAVPGAT